jgi:hypothetical protein
MKNKGEILTSVLKNFKDCYFFLHNTRDFNNVESILTEGFIFENQMAHSTDRVNPSEDIEITYFLFQRKDYGNYTIIIAIPKKTYEEYSGKAIEIDAGLEDVITITEPYFGSNDELMYTLSPKHVLGYFNIKTGEFCQNSNWDPLYNNCHFKTQGKTR